MHFVDECHLFKNLYCPTKMRNIAGLPTADSQRAFDAFIKVRSLLDGGGRVVFATATPVSNTLAEVYVMMKFLQLDLLEEMGIAHFDAWTQLFAETSYDRRQKGGPRHSTRHAERAASRTLKGRGRRRQDRGVLQEITTSARRTGRVLGLWSPEKKVSLWSNTKSFPIAIM